MSSNDMLFMERSSAQVVAVNMAAGDLRSTFGSRWYDDRFWIGGYVTGAHDGRHSCVFQCKPERHD
jgi:phosphate-selective porin OprO/OprP